MYSALKVGGRKLCDLARKGIEIEREARPVTVHSIKARKINDKEYFLDVRCSKGTYIRTLCADIGKKLGTGGVMKTLTRLSASGFTLADAVSLAQLESMSEEERLSHLLPVERVFASDGSVTLPAFFARLAEAGQQIYIKKLPASSIDFSVEIGTRVRLYDKDGFFAIGEIRAYDDGAAIKPIRQFRIKEQI